VAKIGEIVEYKFVNGHHRSISLSQHKLCHNGIIINNVFLLLLLLLLSKHQQTVTSSESV